MHPLTDLTAASALRAWLHQLTRPTGARERGDVPGWVLITIMTAGIVAVLWPLAGDTLTNMLTSALNAVVPGRH
jgi:hypothetical protein